MFNTIYYVCKQGTDNKERKSVMGNSTKELILEYMRNLSEHFDFTMVHQLTASTISDEMHISRSLASQYLNELVKEKRVIKVNSRPVYFLHRKKMEELYATPFQEDDFMIWKK